jgi:hypothetical protein
MAVLKEWRCATHGEFEGSHPICPHQPCRSESVVQEFRTPPKIGTQMSRRHALGLQRTADLYGLTDLRTVREGEISKPTYVSPSGAKLLWGDQARDQLGAPLPLLVDAAQKPLGDLKHNRGMVTAATAAGITNVTGSALPPSFGTVYAAGDAKSAARASAVMPQGIKTTTHKGAGIL